ncbi:ribosome silencing factor [Salinarimonas sp.]|jgi:iojap-like ribosome-associated protein|uniref:ribosome silencing factor n=1 Tax=Salinarimonas sp. TaxID=2766526 RepID=UPI0032D90E1A
MTLAQVSPREAETAPLPARHEADASQDGEILSLAKDCLDDMKAEDVVEIDLVGKTSVADAMLVATGRSDRHVNAIADRIIQTLKDKGHGAPRVEGMPACDWVLIDAGDVIVHVFRPEVRTFYNLEKMWGADRPAERIGG